MNITWSVMKRGFNNPDYFSRLLKNYSITASNFRKHGFKL